MITILTLLVVLLITLLCGAIAAMAPLPGFEMAHRPAEPLYLALPAGSAA